METVNKIELQDESIYPDEHVLKSILGKSYEYYTELLDLYERNEMSCEWRYYKDGKAWLNKVQKKKKTIVWMSARKGYIQATVYLPERLIDQVYGLEIGADTKDRIRNTKNVGKSKPCIFEIRSRKAVEELGLVMQIKVKAK